MATGPDETPEARETTTDALGARGRESFPRLYEKIAPALLVWATVRIPRHLRRYLSPEDVVQEVWFQTSRSLPTYDPTRGTFRGWIFRVAKNVLLQAVRQLRRPDVVRRLDESGSALWAVDELPASITTMSRRLARDEALDGIKLLLASLDREDRELVVHCGLEGMSHAAVAPLLGLTKEAVHKRWQRLKARLVEGGLPPGLIPNDE